MSRITRTGRPRHKTAAFTLVELLVVIGIIAVLIGILLPTLSKAREQANIIKCLSNARQLVLASKMFAADHQGCIPTDSDDKWAELADPYRNKFIYRVDPTRPSGYVKDWASSLMPYLGFKASDLNTFMATALGNAPAPVEPKVFQCPSDAYQGLGTQSGYRLFTNVIPPPNDPNGYFPISYGINADIASLIDQSTPVPYGRFGLSDSISVTGGPNNGNPLQCRIDSVYMPSQVLLFADCGTRPWNGDSTAPLNYNDALYYTTNYLTTQSLTPDQMYTLGGMSQIGYLKGRIPLQRHDKKINVAFADGHGETVPQAFFNKVHISPYR